MRAHALPSAALLLALLALSACAHRGSGAEEDPQVPSVRAVTLGELADGRAVEGFVLDNGRGLTATVSELGAALVRVRYPDHDGTVEDVLLGHDRFADRLARSSPAGTVRGRTVGRIVPPRLEIDRLEYPLATEEGGRHVDGGPQGFGERLWTGESFEHGDEIGVRFDLVSADGDQGYPGRVAAAVVWTLTADDEILCEMIARSDAVTPVDLAPELWFTLGGPEEDARDLELRLWSDGLFEVAGTGEDTVARIAPVTAGPYDFDPARPIGARLHRTEGAFDAVLVSRRMDGPLVPHAALHDPESGRVVEIWSTRPAFRLGSSRELAGHYGLGGTRIHEWTGVMVRPEATPRTHRSSGSAAPLLEPGKEFRERLRLAFDLRPRR